MRKSLTEKITRQRLTTSKSTIESMTRPVTQPLTYEPTMTAFTSVTHDQSSIPIYQPNPMNTPNSYPTSHKDITTGQVAIKPSTLSSLPSTEQLQKTTPSQILTIESTTHMITTRHQLYSTKFILATKTQQKSCSGIDVIRKSRYREISIPIGCL